MKCFERAVVLLVLALLGACSSVGPGTKEVSGGTTVRLERFSFVKEKLAKQVAPSEKVSLHEVQPYSLKGARCARSHMQKAGARGGVSEDSFVLVCAHPAKKGIGVYVEYWQNVLDAPDPKLADKASRLFESVAFTPS